MSISLEWKSNSITVFNEIFPLRRAIGLRASPPPLFLKAFTRNYEKVH
jgi:hypothetical protein